MLSNKLCGDNPSDLTESVSFIVLRQPTMLILEGATSDTMRRQNRRRNCVREISKWHCCNTIDSLNPTDFETIFINADVGVFDLLHF